MRELHAPGGKEKTRRQTDGISGGKGKGNHDGQERRGRKSGKEEREDRNVSVKSFNTAKSRENAR